MKRLTITCILFLLLTSCVKIPASPPFVYNKECLHVCWLGINPSVTTVDEAKALVGSSSQIDQATYIEDEDGFRIEWHTKQMGVNPARVGIITENGKVKSITFLFPSSVKVQEFIDLLGEPDEISIQKVEAAELTYYEYVIYYTKPKIIIFAFTRDEDGPHLEDSVDIMYLDIDLDNSDGPSWLLKHKALRQPWLGFGRADEYLRYEFPATTDQAAP